MGPSHPTSNPSRLSYRKTPNCTVILWLQINEEASDKVLEVEQQYNEKRKPVYEKRNDIIKSIPDFWLTAVSDLSLSILFLKPKCRDLLILF